LKKKVINVQAEASTAILVIVEFKIGQPCG
jgi:hypothetical protein